MIPGIDYSHHNGAPSLAGIQFAFHKVTEGTGFVDPDSEVQLRRIRKAGLVCGAYHFFHSYHDANAQADWFLKNYHPEIGDLIALDFESGGYDTHGVGTWLTRVKHQYPHNKVGVYCNLDYLEHLGSYHGDFLWIADPNSPAGKPRTTYRWVFHQHSTDGGIDHDIANFTSLDYFRTWAGLDSKPIPKPAPAQHTYHTVEKDDTLTALALHYHTSVHQLLAWNSIIHDADKIQVGWKLRVH